jgi:hypothetical protein
MKLAACLEPQAQAIADSQATNHDAAVQAL